MAEKKERGRPRKNQAEVRVEEGEEDDFVESLLVQNARVLASIVVDPQTTENVRIQIINKLLEDDKNESFFGAMFEKGLTYGACPHCQHMNHWLIPEDVLNQMGYVSYKEDPRVPKSPTSEDCSEFQEACPKKKVNF